jgi:hypothetical protein
VKGQRIDGLWALLVMDDLLKLRKLQIWGDLKVAVHWVIGKSKLH